MEVIDIRDYEEEIVLHFGGEQNRINAYTLASTLVHIADAIKEANSIINPGYEIEILVEAFGPGSFRAKVKATYSGLRNLFSKNNLETIAIGILTSYIYSHTLEPNSEVKISVDQTQVVIEQGDKKIIIPRSVYDAQKEVEKSGKFRSSISNTFQTITNDKNITSFGITKDICDQTPAIEIPRDRFYLLASPIDLAEPTREIEEIADLQIKRAILDRSIRKWEFIWRGIKISAPVLDNKFYDDFFAHQITIAPGDSLEAKLKIYQSKDEDTGIFTNARYEVVEVRRHIPRLKQSKIDI